MSPVNSASARKPYQSTLRAQQTAATCRLVVDTAARLFIEHGYAGTSVDAIAEAAGVGRSTVFTAAGGKPWLLKTAYDHAIVGDGEPVPMLERPAARKLFDMTDPAQILSAYAAIISKAVPRVSPLYEVVRSAASVDPEVQQLWTDISEQRLTGAGTLASLLKAKHGLRKGLSADTACDIIWIYNDPGLHHALVTQRHWSQTKYRTWLADTLKQQLLTRP